MKTAFFIAWRYLFSKKGSTAVTFITWLSVSATVVATGIMLIILSVFSGLEDLNKSYIENLHADLRIAPAHGKILPKIKELKDFLKFKKEIVASSDLIEEKVYLRYGERGEIGYLRAVDENYLKVNPIDKEIFYGFYPTMDGEVILENSLDKRLSIPVGTVKDTFNLYMPRPGEGLINSEADIFNSVSVVGTGVFPGKDLLNNYVFSTLKTGQKLLGLNEGIAYNIVLKLKPSAAAEKLQTDISQRFKGIYSIKTKSEENSAFWKMVNTEKIMVYMIFTLVIIITTFNLAGAIIILRMDKQLQTKSLHALGMQMVDIRSIYFLTGLLIVALGTIIGIVVGTLFCLLQKQTGFLMATAELPFPITFLTGNFVIVSILSFVFGGAVSYLFSYFYSTKKLL